MSSEPVREALNFVNKENKIMVYGPFLGILDCHCCLLIDVLSVSLRCLGFGFLPLLFYPIKVDRGQSLLVLLR